MTIITVTATDVAHGCVKDSDCCPLAIAINRVLKVCYSARIGKVDYDIFSEEHQCLVVENAKLPPEAVAFIEAFDAGRETMAISFEIELPERILQ